MGLIDRLFGKKKKVHSRAKKKSKPNSANPSLKKKSPLRSAKKLSVKKPLKKEKIIGIVTHYFPKVKAAVVKIKQDGVILGDVLHIKGHTTDFVQKVKSMQIDNQPIQKAKKGDEIGIWVKSRVRQNDSVYK